MHGMHPLPTDITTIVETCIRFMENRAICFVKSLSYRNYNSCQICNYNCPLPTESHMIWNLTKAYSNFNTRKSITAEIYTTYWETGVAKVCYWLVFFLLCYNVHIHLKSLTVNIIYKAQGCAWGRGRWNS